MKSHFLLLVILIIAGCTKSSYQQSNNEEKSIPIERKYYGNWEKDIDYSQVIKAGKKLYISGITASGDTMRDQLNSIYDTLGTILNDYDTDYGRVIKEVVFIKDIESLKKLKPLRKSYYPNNAYPSSSWIQVDRMFLEEFRLEAEFEVELP